jgi:hypothetical protein
MTTTLCLSPDQRQVLAFFVDNPPEDRVGLLSAVEYLKVIVDHVADTLKDGIQWPIKDGRLIESVSTVLASKADAMVDVPAFWDSVQIQLSKIHPDLKAR